MCQPSFTPGGLPHEKVLFCRSAPSTFPVTWSTLKGPVRGVPSLRLYSEIDHINLRSEAQCVSHHLPQVDCHKCPFHNLANLGIPFNFVSIRLLGSWGLGRSSHQINRKSAPTHETAPMILYKHVILAKHTYFAIHPSGVSGNFHNRGWQFSYFPFVSGGWEVLCPHSWHVTDRGSTLYTFCLVFIMVALLKSPIASVFPERRHRSSLRRLQPVPPSNKGCN